MNESPQRRAAFAGQVCGAGRRIGLVVARFNEIVTERLLHAALNALQRHGVTDVDTAEVPGARELPMACQAMARTGRYDALVALGCVVRGQTPHFEYVAGEASAGISHVSLQTGVPVAFGVLTTDTLEQALDRAGGKMGNAGATAVAVALEMAGLLEAVQKG